MRRTFTRFAALLAAGLTLAGCSGGTGTDPLYTQVFRATGDIVTTRRARAQQAEAPPLTRAVLNQIETSHIEAVIEDRDVTGFLYAAKVRREGDGAQLIQWRTNDNVSLTMRNDVLIATRGLGGDVISAQAPARGTSPGPVSGGQRLLYVRTGDISETRIVLDCTRADLGATTIEIVERLYAVRHVRETCSTGLAGPLASVTYDYWLGNGIAWQSRQWAGPGIGYVRIRRLTTG